VTSSHYVTDDVIMNRTSVPMMESYNSDSVTIAATTSAPEKLLPVPVPDWSRARPVWRGCWPAHIYGFGCAFLLAAALSVGSTPYCFRCRRSPRSTVATSTVSSIVGVVCLAQSCVLLIDAYHSTGLLPVAVVQMVHGLVFPGVVSTLTILDRIFSALVKPRQHLGSIKHPRLIATALSVYLLSTSATYLVISCRPHTRLWLLLCQVVSLTWGCAAVFLVACQCVRLARYARLTARSRRQTAMYIRAKRHVEQCLDAARDSERRYQLLKHLARLRVARTKADEFAQQQQQQQQRMSGLDERGFSDVDLQIQTSTTDSSDQLPSDLEVTKTTTVKLSNNHFQYRRRSRRRRHVTGRNLAYGGSEAVRDFTVTALAAARLLWSPSPDSEGCGDESPSWHVCLHHPADRKLNDSTTGDRRRRGHRTSVTGTDSDDDVDNDGAETDSSSEGRQHSKSTNTTNNEHPVPENLPENIRESGRGGASIAAESDETNASRYCRQLEPASFSAAHDASQRQMSSIDASSRTYLLLDSADAARPLSRRLKSATTRLLHHAAAQWRKSRKVTSRPVADVESSHIACIAESYVLDATGVTARHEADGGSKSSSTLSTGCQLRPRPSNDIVLFENRAYDGRDDVTGCDEAVDSVQPGTSAQRWVARAEADDCRQVSAGYLADTEHDSVDWKHDPDTTTTSSLPLPGSSVYLGLNRLRSGRTVRLVWRTASAVVTSACVVCCMHIYSTLGVFGVLSNDRPASAWPWLGFQTLYR